VLPYLLIVEAKVYFVGARLGQTPRQI